MSAQDIEVVAKDEFLLTDRFDFRNICLSSQLTVEAVALEVRADDSEIGLTIAE